MDAPALDRFCEQQRPQLVRSMGAYCGDRDVAEEIAQEALARAAQHWDEIEEMRAPGAWLHRVAVNLAHTRFRRKSTEARILEQLAEPPAPHEDPDPTGRLAIREALEAIPPRQRAAVTLRYLLDWSVADAAAAMDTTESAVKSLAHRGLRRLRRELSDGDGSLRRTAAGAAVALAVLAVAAALLPGIASSPNTVIIDSPPAPATDDRLAPPPPGSAVVEASGAVTGLFELPGQHPAYGGGDIVHPAATHVNYRFGGADRLFIRGHVTSDATPTGSELRVTAVLAGKSFVSTDGECRVGLRDITRRVPGDPTSGIAGALGYIECDELSALGSSDETIDMIAYFSPQPPN